MRKGRRTVRRGGVDGEEGKWMVRRGGMDGEEGRDGW